ncbi:MAG TPA: DHA2 family efflux MFS transporter permease subunit [Thermoleophilaceae bacterium]|jgi:EmrB/QacA subfamily drug resistance transporter|nr:DHA2 family efflux MFS transporter permease subunit [Thermoleophilaceae bacterium]
MTTDTATDSNRWLALYVLCTGVLMIVLDATVVNVALPSIKTDLEFTQSNLAWVVNAYLIAFGGLLLLAGRLGDLLGHRRIFLAGLGVFTVASLVCGAAQSQEMLIAARFVQGAGGAAASAVTLGMIVTMFPEPRDQAKAIGVFGFVASAGGSIGLLAGGVLTDLINWHWIFFVNVPIGLVTSLLALRLVESRPGLGIREGADAPGAVLVTGGLMLAVYTILGVEEHGWASAQTIILAAVSIGLVAGFIWRQAHIEKPLMPLRLFHSRNVSGANLVMALLVVGMFGIFFLGALYMQLVLGYEPLQVGLAFLPGSLLMGLLSLGFTDKLNMRFGPRRVLITGLCLLLVAMLLFSRAPVDGNYWTDLFPTLFIFGAGAGVAFPALMMLAMSGATPQDAGLASGLVNTTGQVGGAIGLALLATLSTERTASLLSDGEGQLEALNGGYHLAYLIGAAAAVIAIVGAVTVLRSESPAGAMADAHGEPHGEPAYDPA